jgi:glycosyltransferase involved in cell wall biosynthesis
MPTVTTIIPAYNAAAYVGQAIRSALDQRGVHGEVIVIDDGSTDDTAKVLEQFGDAIRVIRQANAGHIAARNRAAKLADGEWLAFLDADDEWLPDKLAKQLAVADERISLVYTERQHFGDSSRVAARQIEFDQLHEGEVFEQLLLNNFITVSSAIMRRSWFERLGGFDPEPTGCEDWDLWLRYAAAGGLVRVVREPLTRYRIHTTAMSTNHDKMRLGRIKAVERGLALPRARQLRWTSVRRALANAWRVAAWNVAAARRWQAVRWYLCSLYFWPFHLGTYKELMKCCLGIA